MEDYFVVNEKKSIWFKAALLITLIMQLSIFAVQFYFLFWYEGNIENQKWYFIVTIILISLGIIGTALTFLLRKIGVYLVIASYFIIILLQPEFSLVGSLSVIFALFFFIVFGLLSIVPRWKLFK